MFYASTMTNVLIAIPDIVGFLDKTLRQLSGHEYAFEPQKPRNILVESRAGRMLIYRAYRQDTGKRIGVESLLLRLLATRRGGCKGDKANFETSSVAAHGARATGELQVGA